MKQLMITAMASGEGKTIVTCGLLQALKMRGVSLESRKCGPDYIDPMFHRRVLGIPSDNLDLFLQGREAVHKLLGNTNAQMMLIEGAMGYYDGRGSGDAGSAWQLSELEQIPALLVVRPKGNSLTLAAQVKGMLAFREKHMLRGIVFNHCRQSVYPHYKQILEKETGLPVLGYLPPMEEAHMESRHLGLVTAEEIPDFRAKIDRIAGQMAESVDLEAVLHLAENKSTNIELNAGSEEADDIRRRNPVHLPTACTIAAARDEAFCFYYESSLRALQACGAKLIFFSPLRDKCLPKCDALYLGGGYPEIYAAELGRNRQMRESIRMALAGGMPAVAECGGFLYLQNSLEDEQGAEHPMAGVLPGKGFRTPGLVRFGYHMLHPKNDSMLFRRGEQIPVHEFHHWDCTQNGSELISEKESGKQWECGYVSDHLYAAFPHLHLGGELPLAQRFVEAAAKYHLHAGNMAEDAQSTDTAAFSGEIADENSGGCPGLAHTGSGIPEEMQLRELCRNIRGGDREAMAGAEEYWNTLAKPLGSLGLLEEMTVKIAGITGSRDICLSKRELLVLCADNGVVRQGVSQSSHDVTTAVALSLARGTSTASYMAEEARCRVYPVNIGMQDKIPDQDFRQNTDAGETDREKNRNSINIAEECSRYLQGFCIRQGTDDITEGPAMTREECVRAIWTGIDLVRRRKEEGASILLAGEMGIGNTTTAAAVSAILLGKDPALLTGRGAGLSDEGLKRKTEVIQEAIRRNRPDPADPIDILQKVGGLDLAGLCGICLGGAYYRVPVLLDGVITLCAACCAMRLCPACGDALLPSHESVEPGAKWLLQELGMKVPIRADLCLGEGTGALLALSLLDQALALYGSGHTFSRLGITPYKKLS